MGMVVSMLRFEAGQLEQFKQDSTAFEELLLGSEGSDDDRSLYLDKAWDGLNHLLTNHPLGQGPEPLCWAIYSTQFFDEEQDLGYGPASYLEPHQVRAVNTALREWNELGLRERFIPERMNAAGVYPGDWNQDPEGQFAYLLEYFNSLRAFFAEAAERNQAIASYIG